MTKPALRVGLLGGSFDPVHVGHMALAQMALEELHLDHVLMIPTQRNPLKHVSTVATAQQRVDMLSCAIGYNPRFGIWGGELERAGNSYTIDTVKELEKALPGREFFFCVGADNLSQFTRWNSWEEIVQRVTLAVAARPGYAIEIPVPLPQNRVVTFSGPNWGISSSEIRERLSQGFSCRYLLSDAVQSYILEHKLYCRKG